MDREELAARFLIAQLSTESYSMDLAFKLADQFIKRVNAEKMREPAKVCIHKFGYKGPSGVYHCISCGHIPDTDKQKVLTGQHEPKACDHEWIVVVDWDNDNARKTTCKKCWTVKPEPPKPVCEHEFYKTFDGWGCRKCLEHVGQLPEPPKPACEHMNISGETTFKWASCKDCGKVFDRDIGCEPPKPERVAREVWVSFYKDNSDKPLAVWNAKFQDDCRLFREVLE